jgi:hypothetical protein
VEFLGTPTVTTAAVAQVDQFERNDQAQRLEEFPAITYLIRWLKKHRVARDDHQVRNPS